LLCFLPRQWQELRPGAEERAPTLQEGWEIGQVVLV
jgi:hypothetical protein